MVLLFPSTLFHPTHISFERVPKVTLRLFLFPATVQETSKLQSACERREVRTFLGWGMHSSWYVLFYGR